MGATVLQLVAAIASAGVYESGFIPMPDGLAPAERLREEALLARSLGMLVGAAGTMLALRSGKQWAAFVSLVVVAIISGLVYVYIDFDAGWRERVALVGYGAWHGAILGLWVLIVSAAAPFVWRTMSSARKSRRESFR